MEGPRSPQLDPHPPASPRPVTTHSRALRTGDGGSVQRRFRSDGTEMRPMKQRVTALEDGPCTGQDPDWAGEHQGPASPVRKHKAVRPAPKKHASNARCMLCAKADGLGRIETILPLKTALSAYQVSCATCHPAGTVVATRRDQSNDPDGLLGCIRAVDCTGRANVRCPVSHSHRGTRGRRALHAHVQSHVAQPFFGGGRFLTWFLTCGRDCVLVGHRVRRSTRPGLGSWGASARTMRWTRSQPPGPRAAAAGKP